MSEEVKFDKDQQALVDKLVGEARVKAREKAQAEFTAQSTEAQKKADEAALVAQEKWQELAAKHEARVKELEPFEAQAQAYSELIAGMLKDRVKELGDAAKTAIGALPETMTAIEKLDWLNKNEGLFQATGDGVGTPGRPRQTTETQREPGKTCRYPIKL